MAQRKLATISNIGLANYSKIKYAVCMAKWKQLPILAQYMKTNINVLLTLWLANHIFEVVEDKKRISEQTLKVTHK
jgi:hypothetical protein